MDRNDLQAELYEMYCNDVTKITGPEMTRKQLQKYASKKQEYFFVITLDGANQIIKIHTITIGIINRTLIHPREVFLPAIKDCANSIIIGHNHPSGNLKPSDQDDDITHKMKLSGEILGIQILDHIIVSKYGYYSYLEDNKLQ